MHNMVADAEKVFYLVIPCKRSATRDLLKRLHC
jgi:hypothetical protein